MNELQRITGHSGEMKKSLYPNLVELCKYHPYHYSVFAAHAGVTTELYIEALKGNEKLTFDEFTGISRLTDIPISVLRCPKLIMLDRENIKHKGMIERQIEDLHKVWDYKRKRNKDAIRFMKYSRIIVVNLCLAFKESAASYCWYLGVQEEFDQFFLSVRVEEEKNKMRGIEH